MQKDQHYYVTYLLAKQAGHPEDEAKAIAWADQYVDEMTDPKPHQIQTQCKPIAAKLDFGWFDWNEPHMQATILVPFHFVPGDIPEKPTATSSDCRMARLLLERAVKSRNPLRIGVALHAYQDSFSHAGFSGYREPLNACFSFWYLRNPFMPDIGHAEMGTLPDITNALWTDPRGYKQVDNQKKFLDAAIKTVQLLSSDGDDPTEWAGRELAPIFSEEDYDTRKARIVDFDGGIPRFNDIKSQMENMHFDEWQSAAKAHLSDCLELMRADGR